MTPYPAMMRMPAPSPSSARAKPRPHRHPLSPVASISAAAAAVSSSVGILLLLTVQHSQANYPDRKGEFCHTDTFRANCSEDEVIIMQTANYGRMKLGRCVEIGLGYVGCFTDVLFMADRRCSGKRICSIRVPDAEFESTRPCLKELKTYLEASYQCVPEFSVDGQSGYIASIVTSDTPSCDGSRQPWSIRAAVGQRINLTLYDFALERDVAPPFAPTSANTTFRDSSAVGLPLGGGGGSGAEADRKCRQYGLLEDPRQRRTFVICGGQTRIRQLYTSEGEVVRIWITAGIGPKDLQRFVIRYSAASSAEAQERNAIGSSHPPPPLPSPSPYPYPASSLPASYSLPPIQLIAIVSALFIVTVAVVMSFVLLAVVKSRRRRPTGESKRAPKQLDTASADFDGKQPLKLNSDELMRDIQTLSSAMTLSAKKDQCHVSFHWDTQYTQMDSFA